MNQCFLDSFAGKPGKAKPNAAPKTYKRLFMGRCVESNMIFYVIAHDNKEDARYCHFK